MGPVIATLLLAALGASAAPGRPSFPRPAIPNGRGSAPRPLDARYALWDGQTAPLALSDEQAPRYAPNSSSEEPTRLPGSSAGSGSPGDLFVSVEFGPQDQLKDAVADLGRAAGFRPDARFSPVAAAHGEGLKVFGWMPGGRLGDASRMRSVRSLEIERAAVRPASGASARIEVLVGVRRAAGLTQAEDDARFSQTMRELADDAQFEWETTAGYQTIPGSSDAVILVVGKVPARRLSRLMENPGVVKIQPFPGSPESESASPRPRSRLRRFLSYVAVQSPLLIVATGLLLVPPIRRRRRSTGNAVPGVK